MDRPRTQLDQLQDLLQKLSNGVWEHGQGIVIENLDNPGWSIRIALRGTVFEALEVRDQFEDRSEHDWLHVKTIDRDHERFLELNCGPTNLIEALDALFAYLDLNTLGRGSKT